jgi:hypothetical protein
MINAINITRNAEKDACMTDSNSIALTCWRLSTMPYKAHKTTKPNGIFFRIKTINMVIKAAIAIKIITHKLSEMPPVQFMDFKKALILAIVAIDIHPK